VRAAAGAGFTQVEFWTTTDKDLQQVEKALRETGITVTGFLSEPTGRLVDPATHAAFLEGVERSVRVAARLNAAT
jgi:hydroxypyruvate isomerase